MGITKPIFILVWLIGVGICVELKLSDSKLLLPYYSHNPINYTIHGSLGACYEWSSGTPEVASITPIFNDEDELMADCSNKAIVTSVWQSPLRAVTTIYAKIQATGQVFKCDVIVDNIHRILMSTTTQELYLHNTPESLIVSALDEFGNTFSSLDGVPFEWRITATADSGLEPSSQHVLRFLTWTESEYETREAVSELEMKGMRGFTQLVSGLRTGSAVVSASLFESVYANVAPVRVRLLVMANAQLSPALAYLAPHSRLALKVNVIQQGHDQEISMPSLQYHLQVNHSDIVALDPEDGSTITALTVGQTQISLLDRNVEAALDLVRASIETSSVPVGASAGSLSTQDGDNLLGLPRRRLPTSLLFVVEPAYLEFSLTRQLDHDVDGSDPCQSALLGQSSDTSSSHRSSSNGWFVESGRNYLIQIDAFDRNGHKLLLTDNVRIDFVFNEKSFEVVNTTENISRVVIRSLTPGKSSLKATMQNLITKSGQVTRLANPITATQDVTTLPSLKVEPTTVRLPWSSGPTDFQLTVVNSLGERQGHHQVQWTTASNISCGGAGEGSVRSSSPSCWYSSSSIDLDADGRINVLGIGESLAIASSRLNRLLCASTRVLVTNPHELRFLPGPSELVLAPMSQTSSSSQLIVGLTVLDSTGQSMTDCRNLNIAIRPLDTSIVRVLPIFLPPRSSSSLDSSLMTECLRFSIIGLKVGFTELEATLYDGQTGVNITTGSRFQLAVYRNIEFIDPPSGISYLAVGSTRVFTVEHGPQPWPSLPATLHYSSLVPSSSSDHDNFKHPTLIGHIESLGGGSSRLRFALRCQSTGSFTHQLQLGNRPSPLVNPDPIVMAVNLTTICDTATSMRLIPHPSLPMLPKGLPPCPMVNNDTLSSNATTNQFLLPNTVPSLVSIAFYGMQGRELEAVDSILTSISLLSTSTSVPNDRRAPLSDLVLESRPEVVLPEPLGSATSTRPYFTLKPRQIGQSAGPIYVRAYAEADPTTSYFSVWTDAGKDQSVSHQLITDLPLLLIKPARFDASSSTSSSLHLLNTAKSELLVPVLDGSGHFHHQSSSNRINVDLLDRRQATALLRVKPKQLGEAVVRLTDLCYPAAAADSMTGLSRGSPVEIELKVNVVGLASLRLTIVDRIPLSDKVEALVEAVDSTGALIALPYARSLHLDLLTADKDQVIVGLPPQSDDQSHWWSQQQSDHGQARFAVRGLALGSTKLSVSTRYAGRPIVSNKVDVQVFSRLRLAPCNFNLLLGAEYELRASGGPQPASLAFNVTEGGEPRLSIVRTLPGSVIVKAIGSTGSSSIVARAVSLSESATHLDGDHPFSTAVCRINVVALSGIRLVSPLPEPLANVNVAPSTTAPPSISSPTLSQDERFLIHCPSSLSSSPSCGLVPLWVEGLASNGSASFVRLTPLEMAASSLHFRWQLVESTTSTGVGHLTHWLAGYGIEPGQTNLLVSAGMLFKSLSPGRVIVSVSVESSLPGSSPSLPMRLDAQLGLTILPSLELTYPSPLFSQRRVLMSPGSRFQLTPVIFSGAANSILPTANITYQVINPFASTSDCPSGGKQSSSPITVSPNGLITASDTSQCFSPGGHATNNECSCRRLVKVTASQPQLNQTLFVDVDVKRPQYVSIAAAHRRYIGDGDLSQSENYLPDSSGLLVGGPYSFDLAYHDQLGRVFDAVSEPYTLSSIDAQRGDLFQLQLTETTVDIHVLAIKKSAASSAVVGLTSTALPPMPPTYLTLPYAGQLLVSGLTDQLLTVGNWICLPNLAHNGRWSSSDPSVVWVDHELLVARRPGHVTLVYSPWSLRSHNVAPAESTTVSPLTYSLAVDVIPASPISLVYSDSGRLCYDCLPLLPLVSGPRDGGHVDFHLMPDDASRPQSIIQQSSPCSSNTELLTAQSPFACRVSLQLPSSDTVVLPPWLTSLAKAASGPTNNQSINDLLLNLISVRLEPLTSSIDTNNHWRCRLEVDSIKDDSSLALDLQPGSQLNVELVDRQQHVLARHSVLPVPGFRMLVPPPLSPATSSAAPVYQFSINNPNELTRRFLLLLPAATSHLVSRDEGASFFARVKATESPQLLTISDPLRPVGTLHEVVRVLAEYGRNSIGAGQSSGWWAAYMSPSISDPATESFDAQSLDKWLGIVKDLVGVVETEADVASALGDADGVIHQRLILTLELTTTIGESPVDTVVPVVISLVPTGQHLAIPVHINLPSRSQLANATEGGRLTSTISSFSWLHLTGLCIIALLMIVVINLLARSSMLVASSQAGVKILDQSLPGTRRLSPRSRFSPSPTSSIRRPWSQGGLGLNHQLVSNGSPPSRNLTSSSPQPSAGGDSRWMDRQPTPWSSNL